MLTLLALMTSLQGTDMSGSYVLQGVREVGSELQLKKDGTFEYMLAYGAADYWAKGSWRVDKEAVVLNSDGPEPPATFVLTKSSTTQSAALHIRLIGANGRPVPNIDVRLLGASEPLKARTDSDGIAMFPKSGGINAVQFEVRVYQYVSEPIPLDQAQNDFSYTINGDSIMQLRFKNERMPIEKGSLLLKYWGGPQGMRYSKGH